MLNVSVEWLAYFFNGVNRVTRIINERNFKGIKGLVLHFIGGSESHNFHVLFHRYLTHNSASPELCPRP